MRVKKTKKIRKKFVRDSEDSPQVTPSPTEFLNRELQWLEFNSRVLYEARDQRTPLLERLHFLSIFSSNLDEFFMKRVGGLKQQVAHGIRITSSDGLTPEEQLKLIRQRVLPLQKEQSQIFHDLLVPQLEQHKICLLKWDQLKEEEKKQARKYFRSYIYPVLTPLSVDPGHPFPFISNLSTSLAVTLTHPEREEESLFARVKVPKIFPQFIKLDGAPEGEQRFISLIELVEHQIGDLFPSMNIVKAMPFRITRNADISRDEEDAEDLLEMITEELKQRRFADAVRIEHGPNPDPWMLDFLKEELELTSEDVFEIETVLDYTDLKTLIAIKDPQLHFQPWLPTIPTDFVDDQKIFERIREKDILVHHPYESFSSSVLKFIEKAASDPQVLAIKMSLYRTGDESPIVPHLIRAAEAGKQVVCLVELKARFDEERNIFWARKLEDAGVHVVYGIVGLKTHCKTLLVVRQEHDTVLSYAHIGTGNYHKETAKFYTDLGLFTARSEITEEVVDLFHFLTGRSLKREYKCLLVAPVTMKTRFIQKIEREIENQAAGRPSGIIAKMNSLEDVEICRALYRASCAGVKIQLIVRGFCCLKPQVVGMSENIKVVSIVGRFLEHSRIFYFRNGADKEIDGEMLIGSADWMYRNLHARVEVVVPLLDSSARARVWEILQINLSDVRQSWEMKADGSYQHLATAATPNSEGSQDQLMALTSERALHEKNQLLETL